MIPAPVFSNYFTVALYWLALGLFAILIWSIFLLVEPRCRASFRRHPWGQGALMSFLAFPAIAFLGIWLWLIFTI